jgi:DNA-directed RNA polymerase III subunit RPC2
MFTFKVKQHIDSYNYFIKHEIKEIMNANKLIRLPKYSTLYLEYVQLETCLTHRFTKMWVGKPSHNETDRGIANANITPNECRLRLVLQIILNSYFFRDITYSAPIYANIRYTRGKDELVQKDSVLIGRMPVMLRSAACVLADCNEQELARKGECPLDPGKREKGQREIIFPGGYFIIRGTEKVMLSQEQLSKNRIIIEIHKDNLCASVTRL